MTTNSDKASRASFKRFIAQEGLSGVLNNTKWQELFTALEPIQGKLEFFRKDVNEKEKIPPYWDSDIYHVFAGWSHIEWLCIRALVSIPRGALLKPKIEDHTLELLAAVRSTGIPYTKTSDGIKIWGYLRPGSSPQWET